jgi:hypothetical protein
VGEQRARSVHDLRGYFREDGPAERLFSGRRFDRVAGRGDASAVRDEITAGDVLSLTFLNIQRGLAELTLAVLDVRAKRIAELLAQIPVGLAMHEAGWEHYTADSPAKALWELLRTCAGQNRWVTANKLLARKRPQLLPVYDNQVADMLGRPQSIWGCLWSWFQENPGRAAALNELRAERTGARVRCGAR